MIIWIFRFWTKTIMFPNSNTRESTTSTLLSSGTEAKRPCLAPSFGLLPKLSTENKFLQRTSSSSTSLISQRRSQLISSLTTQKLVNPLLVAKNGQNATLTKNTTTSTNLQQLSFSTQSKIRPFNNISSTKPNLTLSSERYIWHFDILVHLLKDCWGVRVDSKYDFEFW